MRTSHRRLGAVAMAIAVTASTATAAVAAPAPVSIKCGSLIALGMQGTGESAVSAAPEADTGMLATIFRPMVAQAEAAGVVVDRRYVPYPASFGGWTGTESSASYAESVAEGVDRLREELASYAAECPDTAFALAGYSQGAHAVSILAREIGAGKGPVPAARVGGVAIFGSPTRAAGGDVFPGSRSTTPDALPGTSGGAVDAMMPLTLAPAEGSGIGPIADVATDYGSLSGRVADICIAGDLACDAPVGAPIARAIANVAGQSQIGGDPIVALTSISTALANTAFRTTVDVINEDIKVGPSSAIDTLSINQQKPLSVRLAEASDPRTPPPSGEEITAALMKVGTIGLGFVLQVAESVLTPTNIAAIATAGLANPMAGLVTLGGLVAAAVVDVVPPTTVSRLARETFDVITTEIEANEDLVDLSTLVQYGTTISQHGAYGSTPASATGAVPTRWVADWFAAIAEDATAPSSTTPARSASVTSTPTLTPTSASATPSASTSSAAATTPSQTASTPSTSTSTERP